jgi:CCR4-NOT transcription complex subunit 4
MAIFKANAQKTAKKKQELRQKEVQKKEVESLNRKHLSGLRVVQKNLVYVMGLSPNIPEQEILQTLRGDKYFGQYGKISKIVVSNKKTGESGPNGPSMGVYVTFDNAADAQRCITAVNGSQNGDRTLRAQLGTTKYCSAYLRNEICTNKNCMFLHEPGDNDDSYSRQDLSSINSASTQRPLSARPSSFASSSRTTTTHAPITAQPLAAATQPMNREASKDGSDSGDGSALPTTAHWATKGVQQRSRRGSIATSGAASSPAFSNAMPATVDAVTEPEPPVTEATVESPVAAPASEVATSSTTSTTSSRPERDPTLVALLKSIHSEDLVFPRPGTQTEVNDSDLKFPPLFDLHGGEKRRAMREHQEEARLQLEQDPQTEVHSVNEPVEEEEPESGSLQLGGEPEDNGRDARAAQNFHDQRRQSAQLPIQRGSNGGPFGPSLLQNFVAPTLGSLSSINGRTLTPQQQHQLLLMKSGQTHSSQLDQYPPGMGSQLGQGSGLFQGQGQGHNRQSSRYSFANDGSSGPSTVKASASGKLMAQQSSMMPSGSHAQQSNQYYSASMPGPPPGLKSSGTPPISGMFGQSHAFGGSMSGSIFGAKETGGDLLRDMMNRSGRNVGGGQSHDTGKREFNNSPYSFQQYPSASSTPAPASSGFLALSGFQTGAYQDFNQKQKKKGKKHRHANTSSSGGGGLVDLADPSILQARMQHQHQSNAGVGQGLFGGQAQGGYNASMLYGSGFNRGW